MQAAAVHTAFYEHMRTLYERFDLLVLPVAPCWPFPPAAGWLRDIGGRPMQTDHHWMEATLYTTFASLPASFHENDRWPCDIRPPPGRCPTAACGAGLREPRGNADGTTGLEDPYRRALSAPLNDCYRQ